MTLPAPMDAPPMVTMTRRSSASSNRGCNRATKAMPVTATHARLRRKRGFPVHHHRAPACVIPAEQLHEIERRLRLPTFNDY